MECAPCLPAEPDELKTEELNEGSLDVPASGNCSTRSALSRPRHWELRSVKQKTLSGEIIVRKWMTDEEPAFIAAPGNGELQTVRF